MKFSKSIRHSEKPLGMPLAEALGIEVPDSAPGGAALAMPEGRQGSSKRRDAMATELAYEDFHDIDAYRKTNGSS